MTGGGSWAAVGHLGKGPAQQRTQQQQQALPRVQLLLMGRSSCSPQASSPELAPCPDAVPLCPRAPLPLPQIRLMYLLQGQEGVAQVLGDFEDDKHYHIIMV